MYTMLRPFVPEKETRAYIEEMKEFLKEVWDELPTKGDDWEQTYEHLRFDVLELNPFIPTVDDDYDCAYHVANILIDELYKEAA